MAINLSQFVTGTFSNVSSGNVLFSSAVSSGSLIVTHVGTYTSAIGVFSNVLDNKNAANYTVGVSSTLTADTNAQLIIAYKANISSGGIASTYRVSVNYTGGNVNFSCGANEFTGGTWTAGSTKSALGTSSSPAPGATTASSTPCLFVASFTDNSVLAVNSTMITGVWSATVDAPNANQLLAFGYSTNSSLTQNPTFGLAGSTTWMAGSIIFTGLGAGGAAGVVNPWVFTTMGVQ